MRTSASRKWHATMLRYIPMWIRTPADDIGLAARSVGVTADGI